MTVSAQTPYSSQAANGVTTVFPFAYEIRSETDIVVELEDSDGDLDEQTLGADYTVSGVGSGTGGEITFIDAPASGITVRTRRVSDLLRSIDYQDNGDLLADTLNDDVDALWLALQEFEYGTRLAGNILRGQIGDEFAQLPAKLDLAGLYMAFDADGNPVPSEGTGSDAGLREDLAAVSGAALVGFRQAGTGGVLRSARTKLRELAISCKDFGAVGDGVTDDTAALRLWIQALVPAAGLGLVAGTVPAGIYRITETGVFNDIASTSRTGLLIRGEGMYASIFRLDTSGSNIWFYNNVATARLQFPVFMDVGFEGMDPDLAVSYASLDANAKGFRIYSAGATGNHEQGFQFHRCNFDALDVVESNEGDETSSEIKYFGCKIKRIRSTVKNLNNLQTLNHEYVSTDIEQIYGDIFKIGNLGGGAIKMFGGSVIPFDNGTTDTYVLKVLNGASGVNAYPMLFSGVRFELRGNRTKLASIANLSIMDVGFSDCFFLGTNTADKTIVSIGGYASVKFSRCGFNEQSTGDFLFDVNTVANYGQSGRIDFVDCDLAIDWSDRCTITGSYGGISAIGTRPTGIGVLAAGEHYAHDFDLHWDQSAAGDYTGWDASGATLKSDGSSSDTMWRLKTAQIKMPIELWPSEQEHTLKLPKNAIIKAIHLRKPAFGTSVTVTQLAVGRNNKAGTPHAITAAAQYQLAASISEDNIFYHVGSSANERTLRLYSTVLTDQLPQGGIAIVEYY
jgi:hypothetical protein